MRDHEKVVGFFYLLMRDCGVAPGHVRDRVLLPLLDARQRVPDADCFVASDEEREVLARMLAGLLEELMRT